MDFHHHHHHYWGSVCSPSVYNHHVVSFQSATNSSQPGKDIMSACELNSFAINLKKHDMALAGDWSFAEQAIFNDGIVKFRNEPGMMKYIKISALLPKKTVRDVALRCGWMAKENVKHRKLEETYAGKKMKDRKEKVSSSAKANIHLVLPDKDAAYSFMKHHPNPKNQFPFEVPAIDSATQHLLDENVLILNQISENLSTCQLENNIDLFSHLRDNMTTILNRMSEMPGIMSQMRPLPVSINENLMNFTLPRELLYGTQLMREPRR